ncbi:OprD family outer membrane porin [Pseudomonas sp. TTU2014-080ASC]|uniref:OprD family outer membrane porin n=1 Tax=Pseudomonas sp. TTU2014-080ASC TaxID=1729724 RepID=UPI00071849B1|nr:OprD family outer membrane porin [Pseudomonas sp. TTU2014-080ASC]KRW57498.1 porin [Pseudomonas sp. TTU2014-080ASC]
MNTTTRYYSTLALALAVANTSYAGESRHQADATGFIEGQSLDVIARNFYSHERAEDNTSFRIPKENGSERTQDRYSWVQSTRLKYSSGYTQGTIGFGLDLAVFNAINLEQGKGRIAGGGNRTLANSEGEAEEQWSKMGIANVRLRTSATELKAGRFQVETPVFNSNDNRALPASFTGYALTSDEVEHLTLQAGDFRRASPRTGAGDEPLTTEYGTRQVKGDHLRYLGGDYLASDTLMLSLYTAHFQDVWNQYYFGLGHDLGDRKTLALHTAFNIYNTRDTGAREAGYIDNNIWSLGFTLSHQAHSLTLAWQQVDGDEYFDYVHETAAIYLSNSLYSDYNGPNEKSAQIRYDIDWSYYGVPGLTTAIWYAKGWDIDGTHYDGDRNGAYGNYSEVKTQDDERHREYALSVGYKVQSGQIKDTTFKLLYMSHRASKNQVDGSADELRLVTTLPFNLL